MKIIISGTNGIVTSRNACTINECQTFESNKSNYSKNKLYIKFNSGFRKIGWYKIKLNYNRYKNLLVFKTTSYFRLVCIHVVPLAFIPSIKSLFFAELHKFLKS